MRRKGEKARRSGKMKKEKVLMRLREKDVSWRWGMNILASICTLPGHCAIQFQRRNNVDNNLYRVITQPRLELHVRL